MNNRACISFVLAYLAVVSGATRDEPTDELAAFMHRVNASINGEALAPAPAPAPQPALPQPVLRQNREYSYHTVDESEPPPAAWHRADSPYSVRTFLKMTKEDMRNQKRLKLFYVATTGVCAVAFCLVYKLLVRLRVKRS
jgi:hypothetical protein